ncbi:MAG: hypothetical protein P1U38_09800 [Aeromicrobium sp.]|uniref:hypothetical protein n=1 Tax=Aeromicrobium sp. TaxID=1871063 RepID=UPI0026216B9C|nr:hypothetical protein [Aeromicrobium sp.]MDF1705055.1 hypothetical protein [Aeromicrobium sp.]
MNRNDTAPWGTPWVRRSVAYLAWALDPTNGTAWLRLVAAKAKLQASMDAHPAGKGRQS